MSVYFDKLLEQEGKKEPDVFGGVVVRCVPCLLWQKSRLPAFKNKKQKRKLAHSLLCSLTRDTGLQVLAIGVCILPLLFIYHLEQDAVPGPP